MFTSIIFRAILLLGTVTGVALGGAWQDEHGFKKRFVFAGEFADKASRQASELSQQALTAVKKRRAELEKEVRRLINDEATQRAKAKGSEYKSKALKEVESQRKFMEQEVQRLSKEAELLARQKAGSAERAARSKLAELEKRATAEAKKLSEAAQRLTRKQMAEAEQAAKKRLTALEQTVSAKVESFVDSVVMGTFGTAPKKLLPASVSVRILQGLQILVLCSSIVNFAGPAKVVDIWEAQGFGDEFFPFDLTVNKRILAAAMELCGFLLLLQPGCKQEMAGEILVALYFGWGCISSVKHGLWLYPGIVASLAATLLINELVVVQPTSGGKRADSKWLKWR